LLPVVFGAVVFKLLV